MVPLTGSTFLARRQTTAARAGAADSPTRRDPLRDDRGPGPTRAASMDWSLIRRSWRTNLKSAGHELREWWAWLVRGSIGVWAWRRMASARNRDGSIVARCFPLSLGYNISCQYLHKLKPPTHSTGRSPHRHSRSLTPPGSPRCPPRPRCRPGSCSAPRGSSPRPCATHHG